MENNQFSYEDICRYVGHLYLSNQREIEHLQTLFQARVRQLENELSQLKNKND